MMEGVPWDVADDRSSMTCAAGRARWGVLRLRVEGGSGIYSDGCRGRVLGKVRSLDCVAASIFRLVLGRLLYTPTIHSSY